MSNAKARADRVLANTARQVLLRGVSGVIFPHQQRFDHAGAYYGEQKDPPDMNAVSRHHLPWHRTTHLRSIPSTIL